MTVDDIIMRYRLREHPEGGWYREIYRSETMVASPVTRDQRNAVTQIYFLLADGQISHFHAVSHDEIWHFYGGAPLVLVEWTGERTVETRLGNQLGAEYTHVVRGGTYQAAYSTGEYSFAGCTVAPGFDFRDFRFLKDDQKAGSLVCGLPEKYECLL